MDKFLKEQRIKYFTEMIAISKLCKAYPTTIKYWTEQLEKENARV